jgi:hypothetical protein
MQTMQVLFSRCAVFFSKFFGVRQCQLYGERTAFPFGTVDADAAAHQFN